MSYRIWVASGEIIYIVHVVADDDFNAAFKAGRQVTKFPARYPRPIGAPEFKIMAIRSDK